MKSAEHEHDSRSEPDLAPALAENAVKGPRHDFFLGLSGGGFHRLHVTEWGDPDNTNLLICCHGLTRCGRDFDTLAMAMQDRYRVICPDVVGRGDSDWLTNKAEYTYLQYGNDMATLIAHVMRTGRETVHWMGTSMGGIIGMLLASHDKTPISKLVLNDVGSFIPKASLERIAMYLGASPRFADFDSIVMAVRAVSPFGQMSDDTWRRLTRPLVKQDEHGAWMFRYDPGVGDAFKPNLIVDVDLSPWWNRIHCPVLVTRGADSDLLLKSTFDEMCERRGVRGVEFAGVGHAPAFQDEEQVAAVRRFLLDNA